MNKFLVLAGAATIVLVVGAVHTRTAGPTTISISLQRIVAQSDVGKDANRQLEALKNERGRELLARQKELEDLVRQIAKSDAKPQAERDRLAQDEGRRRGELQQLTLKAQTDFQNEQGRLMAEVRTRLNPILADIAKRSGVDVILNSDAAVVWSTPGSDATNEVLQRLAAKPQ